MAYQFQIYPTGNIAAYRNIVNSRLGVTAIIDKATAINEYMMSGIAFYIQKIEDYINVFSVGTSGIPITSGYFTDLGYSDIKHYTPYFSTSDKVYSGVYEIYSKTVDVDAPDVYNAVIYPTSGSFHNVVFNGSVGKNFTLNQVFISGQLSNLYSGYVGGYLSSEIPIYTTQQEVSIGNPSTYQFRLSSNGMILNNLLVVPVTEIRDAQGKMIDLNKLNSNKTYGILNGNLELLNLISNSGSYITSGNILIEGTLSFDLSDLTSGTINESIFNFDQHTHDGSDSRQITAKALNSIRPIKNQFDVTLETGNIEAPEIKLNTFGLYSNWVEVDLSPFNLNNLQRLFTIGNDLFLVDEDYMINYRTKEKISKSQNCEILGQNYFIRPEGFGDEAAVASVYIGSTDAGSSGYMSDSVINIDFNNYHTTTNLPAYGFGGKALVERRINRSDRLNRLNGNLFLSAFDIWDDNSNWTLSLYEIDQSLNCNLVGTINTNIYNTDILFSKPIVVQDSILYPYQSSASGFGVFQYDAIYYHPTSGILTPVSSGNFSAYTIENKFISGCYGIITNRFMVESTYHDGYMYYLYDEAILKISLGRSSKPSFIGTGLSGICSLISYGGYLYTGKCLERAYDHDGCLYYDTDASGLLHDITNTDDPWIHNPVIYDGWLYAIVPVESYSVWTAKSFDDKFLVDYKLPNNSKLVKRRVGEIDLIDGLPLYTK